jgi:hypothetical protein
LEEETGKVALLAEAALWMEGYEDSDVYVDPDFASGVRKTGAAVKASRQVNKQNKAR